MQLLKENSYSVDSVHHSMLSLTVEAVRSTVWFPKELQVASVRRLMCCRLLWWFTCAAEGPERHTAILDASTLRH